MPAQKTKRKAASKTACPARWEEPVPGWGTPACKPGSPVARSGCYGLVNSISSSSQVSLSALKVQSFALRTGLPDLRPVSVQVTSG